MYKANFNDLTSLLGPVRTYELQPFLEQLKGKTFHHITGPNPPSVVIEQIARWMSIGRQVGFVCTWDRLWADKNFEEACDVLALESLNPSFVWTSALQQTYREGFELGYSSLQTVQWTADVVFIHEVCMLPLIQKRNHAHWVYHSHDYLGHAPRVLAEKFKSDLDQFDAVVFPNASFAMAGLPQPQLWHPTVDILSPRNAELSAQEQAALWPLTQLREGEPYILYADRYDRLEHAEQLLTYYVQHEISQKLGLVLALEAGSTSENAQRRAKALQQLAGGHANVHVSVLPQNEGLLNVLRRRSAVQLYWPKAGRNDQSLIEALWAGSPVVLIDQIGVRDIVRPNVTAVVTKDPNAMLDKALLLATNAELGKGLVERARMHTLDYALLDQELINLACLLALKNSTADQVDWSLTSISAA